MLTPHFIMFSKSNLHAFASLFPLAVTNDTLYYLTDSIQFTLESISESNSNTFVAIYCFPWRIMLLNATILAKFIIS